MSTDLAHSPAADCTPLAMRWRAAWPKALALWSKFTRLRPARLCETHAEALSEGLSGSFAMIRLVDQSVVVDLESVCALGLEDYAIEILAHEIGHHIVAPATLTDQFRLLARMRRALPTLERHAPMVANLYSDLFINDRLFRQAGLRMADVYRQLARRSDDHSAQASRVWTLYLRIYENLWKLDPGSLGSGAADENLGNDAWLGARLIRVCANDWLGGAGRFATLLLPYLLEEAGNKALVYLHDTKDAAEGGEPCGAQDIEADELDGAIHPAEDPRVTGFDDPAGAVPISRAHAPGQAREPFEYGEILKAAGVKLSDHEIAVRYYRERALRHLVPFPKRSVPESQQPQLEGLEPWEIGDPLDELDWLQSVMQSPRVIPGVTTVRRLYGREPGRAPVQAPIDLAIYVDSSGSMPNPQRQTSFLALAGAIIAMSALRAGSSVQATLWSGKSQLTHTGGFVRDDVKILRVLTGYYGGATAFPIHHLRDTVSSRARGARPVHILMISDDGITTMFDHDELGNSGWDIAATALKVGRAGGTMALNLPASWDQERAGASHKAFEDLKRARREQNWDIHGITAFEQLLEFARAFSRRHYADENASRLMGPP